MNIKIYAVSHPGKKRERNEDLCLAAETIVPDGREEPTVLRKRKKDRFLVGVFDGMGGISAGDVASRLSAETARATFEEKKDVLPPQKLLFSICEEANEQVCRKMMEEKLRMGSTASMALIEGTCCTICNLGDSPILLLREGKLTPLYEAHNERAEYEAINGPCDEHKKFRLTQHVGIFRVEKPIRPHIRQIDLKRGDRLLICSDGLSDMLYMNEIEAILAGAKNGGEAVSELLAQALERGGKDNVSILCVEMQPCKLSIFGRKK